MRKLSSFQGRIKKLRIQKKIVRRRYSTTPTKEEPKLTPQETEEIVRKVAPGYENYAKFSKEKLADAFSGKISSSQDLETRYYIARKLLQSIGATDDRITYFDENFKNLSAKEKELLEELLKKRENIIKEFVSKNKDVDFNPILARFNTLAENSVKPLNEPVRVTVTGAAGQIGYALIFRIASGAMFGPKTPVILQLLDLPQALNSLKGVVMELEDSAFPLVRKIVATDNPDVAFEGVDWALLVGAKPRGPGMERADLLKENAAIFSVQGKSLNKVGRGKDTRVVVVGNPANTNALITSANAPLIPPQNIAAMTRLDHNRGLSQLATHLKGDLRDLSRFVIWGNHSATQFPDISHGYFKDKLLSDVVNKEWYVKTFIPAVQKRGAEVIKAKGGLSSAASAASALVDNVRDWHLGTNGKWTSLAVVSNGEYGVTKGLFYSFPVVHSNKSWDIVKDLPIDEFAASRMEETHKELLGERDAVAKLL